MQNIMYNYLDLPSLVFSENNNFKINFDLDVTE